MILRPVKAQCAATKQLKRVTRMKQILTFLLMATTTFAAGTLGQETKSETPSATVAATILSTCG